MGSRKGLFFEGSEFARPCNLLPTASDSDYSATPKQEKETWKLIRRGDSQSPSHERVKIELATYLQYSKFHAKSDPLLWWQSQMQNFPVLTVLAKKYLCICATST